MKAIFTVALLCGACAAIHAEGTVHFGNHSASRVVHGLTGQPVTTADGIQVALYWAPLGSENFVLLGAPADVGLPLPGIFLGGTRTTGAATPGLGTARFQVRAWEASFGATYEAALAAPAQAGRRALVGQSAILEMPTGDDAQAIPPTLLTANGLQAFAVAPADSASVVPTIVCPGNISTNAAPGDTTVMVSFPMPTAVGYPLPAIRCLRGSPDAFPVGVTTVTCIATNVAGAATCSFSVTVEGSSVDTVPPTITCPPDLAFTAPSTRPFEIVVFSVTTTDNADPAPTVVCNPASGSVFLSGTRPVTCVARDASGNSNSCSFNVTVTIETGTTFPTIVCPGNFRTNVPATESSIIVAYPMPVATGNPAPEIICNPPSLETFFVGATAVSCRATNVAGTALCSFTVTVVAPCGGGTVSFFNNSASAVSNFLTGARVPAGSIFLAGLYYLPDTGMTPSEADFDEAAIQLGAASSFFAPGLFNGGTRTTPLTTPGGAPAWFQLRVWESAYGATYEAAFHAPAQGGRLALIGRSNILKVNTGSACVVPARVPGSLTLSGLRGVIVGTWQVQDFIPPSLLCPSALTVTALAGQSSQVVNYTATATDNVDPAPVVTCNPPSGSSFPVGTTAVTCTARDFSFNSSTCTFTVTVVASADTTPPTLTCPANLTVPTLSGEVTRVVTFTATATDNVDPAPEVTCSPPSGSVFLLGSTPVSCTATDSSGNSSQCTFTVTVNQCAGGTVIFQTSSQSLVSNLLTRARVPAGSNFLAGLYYLPDRATAPSDWEFDFGTQLGASGPFLGPGIFLGGVRTTPSSTPGGAPAWFQVRVWESTYGSLIFTTYEQARDYRGPTIGHWPLLGRSAPVKVTTGNPCQMPPTTAGSLATAGLRSFYVVGDLTDSLPPVLVCSSNLTVVAPANHTSEIVTYIVTATDDYDPAPVVTCLPPSASAFPVGTTTVNCTARDWNFNSSTCTFSVTVVASADTTPPTLTCPANLTVTAPAGQSSQVVNYTVAASDNVDPAPVVMCNPPSGSVFLLGSTPVSCTATDSSGNSSQCSFNVSVSVCAGGTISFQNGSAFVSNILTMARVPAGSNFLAALYHLPDTGSPPSNADFDHGTVLGASVRFIIPGSFNGGTRTTPPSTPGGSPAWFQVRVWESLYGAQTFTSYEQARDYPGPFVGGPPLRGMSVAVKVTTGNPCLVPPIPGGSLMFSGLKGFYVMPGPGDFFPPTLVCPSNLTALTLPGQTAQSVSYTVAANDNVDPDPFVSCSPLSGSLFPLGTTWVTCEARDFSGNRTTCSFAVTVESPFPPDNVAPVIVCPSDLTVAAPTGQTNSVVTYSVSATDDQDPAPVVVCSPPSGFSFPVGTTTVNCTAQDRSGNSSQCSFAVSVTSVPCPGGTVAFFNAPMAVSNILTMNRIPAGSNFLAALYHLPDASVAPTDHHFDAGTVLGASIGFFTPGIFNGGTRTTPATTSGGTPAWFQFRVWESVFGPHQFQSFEEARDSLALMDGRRPLLGVSPPIRTRTGNPCLVPPTPPGRLTNFNITGFYVTNPPIVGDPPRITAQPQDQMACGGQRVTFAVEADGTAPLAYQWMRNDTPLPGETNAQLLFESAHPAHAGDYAVAVANDFGAVTSLVATLTLDAVAPVVELNGAPALTIECPEGFTDPGASAHDACDGALPVTVVGTVEVQVPGRYVLTYTSTDSAGNASTVAREVTVADATPPAVTCPPDVTVDFQTATGAVLTWPEPSASDRCAGTLPATCVPPSGSVFAIGTNWVHCRATDPAGNRAECAFKVIVRSAHAASVAVLEALQALRAGAASAGEQARLDDAIQHLTASLRPDRWVDGLHLERKHGDKVFQEQRKAVEPLLGLLKDLPGSLPAGAVQNVVQRIVAASRLLAWVAIQDSQAAGAAQKKIAGALKELAVGDSAADVGRADRAIEHYERAWKHAVRAKIGAVARVRDGRVQLEILGDAGETLTIEASTNLADWQILGQRKTGADGTAAIEDADAPRHPFRVYRVITPTP